MFVTVSSSDPLQMCVLREGKVLFQYSAGNIQLLQWHNAQTIYIPDYIGRLSFVSNFCTEHWDCRNYIDLPCVFLRGI